MVSTIEALYYASVEVAKHKGDHLKEQEQNLIHLLWLFAEQRILIQKSSKDERSLLPFSEAGKEKQRSLRRYEVTEKQARDKEVGRELKEKVRRAKEVRKNVESVSLLSYHIASIKL